jgi:hypothetical protein
MKFKLWLENEGEQMRNHLATHRYGGVRGIGDWQMRLVYADWLEENGQPDLANAHRWMTEHWTIASKSTTYYEDNTSKIIWCWAKKSPNSWLNYALSEDLFDRLQHGELSGDGTAKSYNSLEEAENDLAQALKGYHGV